MRDAIHSTVVFVALMLATISTSLVFPGLLGAVTPVPLSFSNAIGVLQLGSVFMAVCVVFYGFGRLRDGSERNAAGR